MVPRLVPYGPLVHVGSDPDVGNFPCIPLDARCRCIVYSCYFLFTQTDMEPVRTKVVDKFAEALGNRDMAKKLERCVYNWSIRTSRVDDIQLYWENPPFRYRYTTKALSLHFNLKNPKNPTLLERVLSGSLGLKNLTNASPTELFPEHWEAVHERVAARQLRKHLYIDVSTVPDGAFTCSKCKSKKTSFVEMQTRSADEPMTLFIQCLSCSKRWKQ